MSFSDLVEASKIHFPELQVKFKNESPLMRLIGKILFFNKEFMTGYATTIGNTMYFPSQEYVDAKRFTATVIFLHELVHIHDSKKEGMLPFKLSYLFPQILALLALPLLLVSWKIALLPLLFLLPIPSVFRRNYELRGYKVSLYASKVICDSHDWSFPLDEEKDTFVEMFTGSHYYFMWRNKEYINSELSDAVNKINNKQRPFEDPIFDIIDELCRNNF